MVDKNRGGRKRTREKEQEKEKRRGGGRKEKGGKEREGEGGKIEKKESSLGRSFAIWIPSSSYPAAL